MNSRLLAVLLVAAGALPASGSGDAGTTGGAFLRLGADARASGMGQAVSAAAEDSSAVYWNPANLAGLRDRHAAMTHAASGRSTFLDFISYAQPKTDRLGAIGAAVLYQNSGSLAEIDNTGAPTGDSFTPRDYAAMLGWGATLGGGLDIGLSFKYVSSKIESAAAAAAADFGARWRMRTAAVSDYAVAVTVRNVGSRLKFREISDPLPLTVAVGQALRPWRALTLTADVTLPRDEPAYASLGVEWRAPMSDEAGAVLRGGYDGRVKTADVGGMAGLGLGGGLDFRRLGFDYAWTPAGDLGSTHRLSLSYRF